MNLWDGIDSAEAEAQLRGLNRRLADLDEAMQGSQRLLADNPDSFAAQLGLNSLSQLQERLQVERVKLIRHRERERVAVALNGADFDDHSANLGRLGYFLVRMQNLYQSIGQAITTGPRLRGKISQEVMRATDLRLAGVFPSSFGMDLFVASSFDMYGESTAVSALQTLFNLLTATKRETEIARLSAELGQRSVNNLRKVLDDLIRAGAGFSVSWTDSAGTKFYWDANTADIPQLRANISRFSERSIGQRVYDGALTGASLLRNRFEFMTTDRVVLEGKITREVRPQMREYFGRICRVTLDQVEVVETVSGETKSFFTLTGIGQQSME